MALLTKLVDENRLKSHLMPIQHAINELEITIADLKKRDPTYKLVMCTNPYNPLVVRVDFVDDEGDEEFAWVECLTEKVADEVRNGRFW